MAGKSSAFDPYYSAVASRLRDDLLLTPEDTKKLAEYLGCSVQAISQYKNGLATPKMENLISIAHYFGCSLDYLIGLSEVRTPSADIQAMCEYTGLSEKAIRQLHANKEYQTNVSFNTVKAINMMLENVRYGNSALVYIYDYLTYMFDGFGFAGLNDEVTKKSNFVSLCKGDKPLMDVHISKMSVVIMEWIKEELKSLREELNGDEK